MSRTLIEEKQRVKLLNLLLLEFNLFINNWIKIEPFDADS